MTAAVRCIRNDFITAFVRARLVINPFFHVKLHLPFHPDLYRIMLKHLPLDGYRELRHADAMVDGHSTRLLHELTGELPPVWEAVCEAVMRPEVQDAVVGRLAPGMRKFGVLRPVPMLCRDLPGYRIRPHADIFAKFATVQIYLPPADMGDDVSRARRAQRLGTQFYNAECLSVPSQVIPFQPNSGYAFAVNGGSWHGVRELPEGEPRDSLMLIYYEADKAPEWARGKCEAG